MPELPEVETIRAQLAPRLIGRTLVRAEILDPRLTRPYDLFEVAAELEGDRAAISRTLRRTCSLLELLVDRQRFRGWPTL